jgi:hypothetical protein
MLIRPIKYTDFDGVEHTETFHFNLTRAEVVELEVGKKGGLDEFIRDIVKTQDNAALVAEFKRIILLSYGQRSEDGKRFIKSDALREEFSQTAAFDELFIELATSDTAAATFIQGILPKDMQEEIKRMDAAQLPPPVQGA